MNIKRYDCSPGVDGYMSEDADGEYVRHKDIAAVLKDAERYRWLRREHASDGPSYHVRRMSNCPAPKDLDSDIDAAMREQGANA